MISEYPSTIEAWKNERLEYQMVLVDSIVKCIRSLRGEVLGKQKNERLPAFAFCQSDAVADVISSHELEILTLATLSSVKAAVIDEMDTLLLRSHLTLRAKYHGVTF
ncbi:valyl-tRNA synthetase / valine--tRNA ligase-related [Euphorbia peplus]|nr:valyl-tRNA synthetase / valine--tRNA ligase-related [Euphorbia peplus]